jgi:hypothetical protein
MSFVFFTYLRPHETALHCNEILEWLMNLSSQNSLGLEPPFLVPQQQQPIHDSQALGRLDVVVNVQLLAMRPRG